MTALVNQDIISKGKVEPIKSLGTAGETRHKGKCCSSASVTMFSGGSSHPKTELSPNDHLKFFNKLKGREIG